MARQSVAHVKMSLTACSTSGGNQRTSVRTQVLQLSRSKCSTLLPTWWCPCDQTVVVSVYFKPVAHRKKYLVLWHQVGKWSFSFSFLCSWGITRFHWTLLTVSTGRFSWGLQKPLDFFDHEVCQGCALGPDWDLSTGVPCAPKWLLFSSTLLICPCYKSNSQSLFTMTTSLEDLEMLGNLTVLEFGHSTRWLRRCILCRATKVPFSLNH